MAHYSFWRLPKVVSETGFSKSSIYRLGRLGEFPMPVKTGVRAAAWRSDQVLAWMQARGGRAEAK
jgi:prophage regulatory protein